MFNYLGFGLVGLLFVMLMPAEDAVPSTGTSLYGIATLSVLDSQGNVILTNIVHNEVTDEGTLQMLGSVADDNNPITGATEANSVNAICLTDETGGPGGPGGTVTAIDDITSANYVTDNGLDTGGQAGNSCREIVTQMTVTANQLTHTTLNFAAGGTNVPDGTVITGFVLCNVANGGGDVDLCVSTQPLLSAIASTVTLNTGETVDITYTLNLD